MPKCRLGTDRDPVSGRARQVGRNQAQPPPHRVRGWARRPPGVPGRSERSETALGRGLGQDRFRFALPMALTAFSGADFQPGRGANLQRWPLLWRGSATRARLPDTLMPGRASSVSWFPLSVNHSPSTPDLTVPGREPHASGCSSTSMRRRGSRRSARTRSGRRSRRYCPSNAVIWGPK